MDDTLKTKLKELGLTDEQIEKLASEGAATEADIALLSADDIKTATACGIVSARKVANAFAPTAAVADPAAEIGEDEKPTTAQVNGLAASLGVDPSIFMMMFAGGGAAMGSEMDISGMIPIPGIVDGYNPKVRNMFLMIMGQLEPTAASTKA
jgi:hypothetical protein